MEDVAPTTKQTTIAIRKIRMVESYGQKRHAGKSSGASVVSDQCVHGESNTVKTKMLTGSRSGATAAKVIQKKKRATGSWCNH